MILNLRHLTTFIQKQKMEINVDNFSALEEEQGERFDHLLADM